MQPLLEPAVRKHMLLLQVLLPPLAQAVNLSWP
jgi:hypothetical protein